MNIALAVVTNCYGEGKMEPGTLGSRLRTHVHWLRNILNTYGAPLTLNSKHSSEIFSSVHCQEFLEAAYLAMHHLDEEHAHHADNEHHADHVDSSMQYDESWVGCTMLHAKLGKAEVIRVESDAGIRGRVLVRFANSGEEINYSMGRFCAKFKMVAGRAGYNLWISRVAYMIVKSNWFTVLIHFLIVVNTFALAWEYFDFPKFQRNWWEHFQDKCAPITPLNATTATADTAQMFLAREAVRAFESSAPEACAVLLRGESPVPGQSPMEESVLHVINLVLLIAFTLEILIKILGLGLLPWFYVPFNLLDACIVVAGLLEKILGGGLFSPDLSTPPMRRRESPAFQALPLLPFFLPPPPPPPEDPSGVPLV